MNSYGTYVVHRYYTLKFGIYHMRDENIQIQYFIFGRAETIVKWMIYGDNVERNFYWTIQFVDLGRRFLRYIYSTSK